MVAASITVGAVGVAPSSAASSSGPCSAAPYYAYPYYASPYAGYPVYPDPVYASSPAYQPQTQVYLAPSVQREACYVGGCYHLHGDGVTAAYQWVWVPSAPPPPPGPPG